MEGNETYKTCLFLEIHDVSGKPLIKFTAIGTSVIGLLSSIGSVFGNALVLYVIATRSRLQTPSNVLLGNLCISDFITGLIVVPTIAIRRLTEAYGKGVCAIRLICAYFAYLTAIVSVVSVCMISIDRCFAIMRPFVYQRTVTVSRYIFVVLIMWIILCTYSGLPFLLVLSGNLYFEIVFIVMILTIVIFLVCYAKISIVARSHRRKLRPSASNLKQEGFPTRNPEVVYNVSLFKASDPNTGNIQSPEQHLPATANPKVLRSSLETIEDNSVNGIQPYLAVKSDAGSLNDGINNQSAKNLSSQTNFANCKSSNSKILPDSINSSPEDVRTLQFPAVEPRRTDHASTRHEGVTLTNPKRYNISVVEQKRTNTVAILVLATVLCYGPLAIIYVLRGILGDTFEIVYIADPWADLILYVNSTINPIIYCLRGKELRDAVKRVLPQCLLDFFHCVTGRKQE